MIRIRSMSKMPRAAVGIGSNAADAPEIVRRALRRLGELGTVVARSALYRTAPWGVIEQDPFVNAAAAIDTVLEPRALLGALKRIEAQEGRIPTSRWGPRVLDLDILTYGDLRLDEPELSIPHPRLHERAFALVPLAEIDPRFAPLRDALPPGERAGVVELERNQMPTDSLRCPPNP
jgi:2-amino-4-hydroxy-6-hydroxymethyldihydropteridine diphosphokinase